MENHLFTLGVISKIGNTKKINQYSIRQKLGEGGTACVKLCEVGEMRFVISKKAAKIIKKSMLRRKRNYLTIGSSTVIRTALDDVYKEIQALRSLASNNVLKIYEVIELPEKDQLYMSTR